MAAEFHACLLLHRDMADALDPAPSGSGDWGGSVSGRRQLARGRTSGI